MCTGSALIDWIAGRLMENEAAFAEMAIIFGVPVMIGATVMIWIGVRDLRRR